MAVSFAASSASLATYGFSAGDIIALAGAGRNVTTWVMAQIKDQNLLDFLDIAPEDLIPRKAIVDPIALHERWDVALTLLKNGRRSTVTHRGTPVTNNMPKFSWFMTLVMSGLDASLGLADLRRVTSRFLNFLFIEQIDDVDYIQRELPQHVQGWISAACVRNISTKARSEWAATAKRGPRPYGQIPSDDCQEVERLLIWLSGACGQKYQNSFETASSDVYALATVYQAIGFDLISTDTLEGGISEARLKVIYNANAVVVGRPSKAAKDLDNRRRGMRLPLDYMDECVSLWPGSLAENNLRRILFKQGMEAAETVELVGCEKGNDISYIFKGSSKSKEPRVNDTLLATLRHSIFPDVEIPLVVEGLSHVVKNDPQWSKQNGTRWLEYLETNSLCVGDLQIFVMGFYYAVLKPLLDTSQLALQEGYGDWQWNDLHFLRRIKTIMEKWHNLPGERIYGRIVIIELLGIFFAGADEVQCSAINDGVVGLHGKTTIVPASMLGQSNIRDVASKFCLLDLDATAIPSNARGMILNGNPSQSTGARSEPSADTELHHLVHGPISCTLEFSSTQLI